jgi:hypothetical protein
MTRPFERRSGEIHVGLTSEEVAVLATLPGMVEEAGDAGGRLDYRAHPEDSGAETRYRELVGESLADARRQDRASMIDALGSKSISIEDAEAWMRVIGEARIAIAVRLGIEKDGWEADADQSDPEMALLTYLGYLQDQLVEALT